MNNRDSLKVRISAKKRITFRDIKSCTTCCCYVICLTLIEKNKSDALVPIRCESLPCTDRAFGQKSCKYCVGCLAIVGIFIYGLALQIYIIIERIYISTLMF